MDQAIPPHGSVDFDIEGVRWGTRSVPASVSIGLSSVQTEKELPPVTLPQPGEFLYRALNDEKLAAIREQPPVELAFHIDRGGFGQTAVFGPGEELGEFWSYASGYLTVD